MLVYLVSLGCPKNFVDTEIIAGTLIQSGKFNLTFDQREADITLINTCAFLPSAREETYDAIKDAIKWKKRKKNRMVAVAGCLIQWDKNHEFLNSFPEVDFWNGVDGVADIVDVLGGNAKVSGAGTPCYIYDENTARLQLTLPHVAYLKIADGCDNRCSYCSIPNIRGALRSRSIASCVAEAVNLLNNDVKEIVLIAQDVTAFGQDNNSGENLEMLLKELDKLEGDFWIRLLYTHPAHYTDTLIQTLSELKHTVRYLDIPLQHISDNILNKMGRKSGKSEVVSLLKKLRSTMPDVAIRTTFITGFPGETEADFAELCEFVKEFKFHRLGVFEYSAEPNTPAANMENQIPNTIATARAEEIMTLQMEISLQRNIAWIGKTMTVLLDEAEGRSGIGRSFEDAPEIDNCILVKGKKKLHEGEFYQVRILSADEYDLNAEVIN